MDELELPESPYGRHRICPQCGARVAQRADTCFACGALLAGSRKRWRPAIPWADIILVAVIAGLVTLWWTHPPATAVVRSSAISTPTPASLAAAWQPNITPEPTGTPTPRASDTPLPPTPAPTAVPTPLQYKVSSGDSFGLIADKYGVKLKDLLALNNLGGNEMLHPGDLLKIPGAALPPTATPAPSPTGGTLIYKVQAGDTLFDLADQYGADIDQVLSANKMHQGDLLSIGQVILIPLGGTTPTPTPTVTGTAPAPTFTPGAPMRAPSLLLPADNGVVEGDLPLLSWTSVGLLGDGEYYVVVLRPDGASAPLPPYWTKTTSWRVPSDYRPVGRAGAGYTWQVQLVRGKPGQSELAPVNLGATSAPRHFVWN